MKIQKITTLLVSILILSACASDPSPNSASDDVQTNQPPTEKITEILGINVEQDISKSESFSPIPKANYYYGQLLIDTKLFDSAVEGPEARKLMNYVISIFGSEKKQFGLSVIPKLNNIPLPEFVVFSYKYDGETNSWSSSLTRKYRSPAISLTALSELEFEFKYVASNETNVAVAESVADIISGYSGIAPGAWSISKLSQPKVKEAALNVDRIISGILSNSVSANVTDKLEPVTNGSKSIVYLAKDSDGNLHAEVKFTVRLITSLVSGQAVSDIRVESDFAATGTTVDPFTNPLNRIRVNGGSDENLRDALIKKGLLSKIAASTEPNDFRTQCRAILDTLETDFGLNIVDRLNAFSHVVRLTNFLRDKGLYTSNCLFNHELKLLNDIGIPLEFEDNHAITVLNDDALLKLAGFFKSPIANVGFRPDLLNMFESDIRVTSGTKTLKPFQNPMSIVDRQSLVNRFAALKAATVCCWGGNVLDSEGVPNPLSKPILFRTLLAKTIYVMELHHLAKDKPVDFVTIREISEHEISPINQLALLKPAKTNVENFELDIVRRQSDE